MNDMFAKTVEQQLQDCAKIFAENIGKEIELFIAYIDDPKKELVTTVYTRFKHEKIATHFRTLSPSRQQEVKTSLQEMLNNFKKKEAMAYVLDIINIIEKDNPAYKMDYAHHFRECQFSSDRLANETQLETHFDVMTAYQMLAYIGERHFKDNNYLHTLSSPWLNKIVAKITTNIPQLSAHELITDVETILEERKQPAAAEPPRPSSPR